MAISSILVANRGEIACRVMRTARTLGLRNVAVYSEADAGAPHVTMADEALCIGPAPAAESYLNTTAILQAARQSGADAIHPGYGFLSENDGFARAVAEAGLIFVGPPPEAIRAMGNKAEAKRLMQAAGVPCVPGYEGEDQSDAAFVRAAARIGFPVMVKAAAGGGGRGMRLVHRPEDLIPALALARSEAASAFRSDEVILERAILRPRHVEVQILADDHGGCIHLGERDCSVQRRHQKVVEEAPCPVMTPDLRAAMGAAAVSAAQSVDYRGAGTAEFLLDASGAFYFLEMNTRLQVEHPVTEAVTGLDLVALQIAVANGDPLPFGQNDVTLTGHAIEARLYAEDPARDFLPATGRIDLWLPASGDGVRIDAGVAQGQEVSPFYDPMLAKIIASGPSRDIARARLIRALTDTVLFGPATNTGFLVDVLSHDTFATGQATTAFLGDTFPDGVPATVPDPADVALAAALVLRARQMAAFTATGYVSATQLGWSSAAPLPIPLTLDMGGTDWAVKATIQNDVTQVTVDGISFDVSISDTPENPPHAMIDGRRVDLVAHLSDPDQVWLAIGARRLQARVKPVGAREDAASSGTITAPMPGLVVDVGVTEGATVTRGEVLVVLEAMKMQHQITAPIDGRVTTVAVQPGAQLGSGDLIVEITAGDDG